MRRSKEKGIEDNDFFWGRPNLEADVPNITFNVIIVTHREGNRTSTSR